MGEKTEVTKDEYRAKERERDRYKGKIKECEKDIGSIEDQIAALDKAIEEMTEVNSGFSKEVKKLAEVLEGDYEFDGDQHDKTLVAEGTRIYASAVNSRDNVINNALDKMEWLRNDLRKQRNSKYGLLGELQSCLSSAWTWLKTHFFN